MAYDTRPLANKLYLADVFLTIATTTATTDKTTTTIFVSIFCADSFCRIQTDKKFRQMLQRRQKKWAMNGQSNNNIKYYWGCAVKRKRERERERER
jgi:hypothetical protein